MSARKVPVGAGFATQLLLDAAVEIRQKPDAAEAAFIARQLVQCTLPHSDPGDVPAWTRTNGSLTMIISPYFDRKLRRHVCPYGSIPRLLLFWIVTEAKRKNSRMLHLGNSLDAFMREVGLNPRTGGGKRGDAKRLHEQMNRLIRATISFEDERAVGALVRAREVDMPIAPKRELWWEAGAAERAYLFDSWIELGEEFFAAICKSAVPVDLRALRALKRSPLALDLYAWLTYTAFVASRTRNTRLVPWEGLHAQMGAEYAELRDFRKKVLAALRKIVLVYPSLRAVGSAEGLAVHPSPTAIAGTNN